MKRRLLASLITALSTAALVPGAASAATTLQPGAYMETDVGSCTMNFAYAGNGKTYLGTAAHCVSGVGQRVRDYDGVEFGSVAFVGDENNTAWDFAFIEVDPEDAGRVSAAVKGHPSFPTGATSAADTLIGDEVQLSGYGLGYGTTQPTQEIAHGRHGLRQRRDLQRQRPDPLGRLGRTARPPLHRQGARHRQPPVRGAAPRRARPSRASSPRPRRAASA